MPVSGASRTCPVTKSAQVEALTNVEWLSPKCLPHSDGAILSSINASMVAASGTRSSASARIALASDPGCESSYRTHSSRAGCPRKPSRDSTTWKPRSSAAWAREKKKDVPKTLESVAKLVNAGKIALEHTEYELGGEFDEALEHAKARAKDVKVILTVDDVGATYE